MRLLLTGATGKVGQNFLSRLSSSQEEFSDCEVVALCHNRKIPESERIRVVSGSLADASVIHEAMEGVTHVLHMAAVKEAPELAIDVSAKGMFLLLEEARRAPELQQFILISGDCTVGHIFHDYPEPITETSPRMAYPGCYALTKVLEEVMIEQYQIQYGLRGTVLRAPWIMEKDDFKFALKFGPDQFGGPAWSTLISAEEEADFIDRGAVPLMLDATGAPLKRNFVHVDDLVSAIFAALGNADAEQSLFNVAMNEPVDYARVADYLARTQGMEAVTIQTPFHSNWLDNSKMRLVLGWQPDNDFEALIERAWAHKRAQDDPRKIWYPG